MPRHCRKRRTCATDQRILVIFKFFACGAIFCLQSKPNDGETGVMGQLMQGGSHDDYLSRAWHFPINDQERFVEGVLKAPTQALGSGGKG